MGFLPRMESFLPYGTRVLTHSFLAICDLLYFKLYIKAAKVTPLK